MRKTDLMESRHPMKLLFLLEATVSAAARSPLNEISHYFGGLCLLKLKLGTSPVTALEVVLCFSCKY